MRNQSEPTKTKQYPIRTNSTLLRLLILVAQRIAERLNVESHQNHPNRRRTGSDSTVGPPVDAINAEGDKGTNTSTTQ
jgi:hypothetical protein